MKIKNNSGFIHNGDGDIKGSIKIDNSKKITISIGVAVIVLAIFLFVKLGREDSIKGIVGIWDSDNGYVMEFMSDGTVRQGDENGWEKEGVYELMDEGVLKISDTYGSENVYFDIKISGNSMSLSAHDNSEQIVKLKKR